MAKKRGRKKKRKSKRANYGAWRPQEVRTIKGTGKRTTHHVTSQKLKRWNALVAAYHGDMVSASKEWRK